MAREVGLAGRSSAVMQACFFALSDVMPRDAAMAALRADTAARWQKRGPEVARRNLAALAGAPEGFRSTAEAFAPELEGLRYTVQVASALLQHGPARVGGILAELRDWLAAHGHPGPAEIRGLRARHPGRDPAAWERLNYIRMLGSCQPPPGWR